MKYKNCANCSVELTAETMHHPNAKVCRECFSKVRVCCRCKQTKAIEDFLDYSPYCCKACTQKRSRPGDKTCTTCGHIGPAVDFPKNSKDCADCYQKRRKCTECKQVRAIEDFHRTASGVGLRRVCIDCVNRKKLDAYHKRPRPCKCCGQIKTSFPLNAHICTDCYGKVRRCPACDTVKPVDAFGKDATQPSGLQGICRECVAIRDRDRRSVRLTTCLHCGEDKPRTEFQKDKKVCNACKSVDHQTCNICGINQPLSEFPENDPKQALGKTNRCRSCLNGRQRTMSRTASGRHSGLRSQAKRQGYPCTITFEEHAAMIQQPCHYCGHPLNETGSGLDRIDPNGGYTMDNVVPCCRDCNSTKSDRFTYEEMLVIGDAIGRVKYERASHESSPPDVDAVSSQ